jgi:glutaredoxin
MIFQVHGAEANGDSSEFKQGICSGHRLRRKVTARLAHVGSPVANSRSCGTLPADHSFMNKPKIIAYLKPTCGWSQGVRAIMRKYDLSFEDRDIINDPIQRQEMIEKSGQMLSPCVEVNGKMLPDISGEEVEAYLLANNLVQPVDKQADSPTNQPCAHEMPSAPLNLRR